MTLRVSEIRGTLLGPCKKDKGPLHCGSKLGVACLDWRAGGLSPWCFAGVRGLGVRGQSSFRAPLRGAEYA